MAYTVLLDTLRDYTFGGTHDDISSYVSSISWNVGMAGAYDEVARPAQCQLTLKDVEGLFHQDTLGGELVSNGNFVSWLFGTPLGWTVTGESGGDPEVSEVGATMGHGEGGTGKCNLYTTSAAVSISQAVLTAGTRYKVTLTVDSSHATGGVVVTNGGAAVSPVYHAPGIKTFTFTATATDLTIAADGAANITIDDVSCAAMAQYGGTLAKGTVVRVKHDTDVLFEGTISSVVPWLGMARERLVRVTVEDAMLQLLDAEYAPDLLENSTVDVALEAMFDEAIAPYPYEHAFWLLEVEGCSELETTTTLYEHSMTDFSTGSVALDWIGDNQDRGKGLAAQGFIRDLVATEFGGRFFWQPRVGKYVFHSRHRDVLDTSNDASFTLDDFVSATPSFGDDLMNVAVIDFEPRRVGTPGTVIWEDTNVPYALSPGEPKKIQVRFQTGSDENASVGAKDILPLAKGIDYIANAVEDGGGANRSGFVGHTLDSHAGGATLTIYNTFRQPIYITTLQIRGTPLLRYPRESVTALDGESIRENRRSEKSYTVQAVTGAEYAQAGADWLVSKFKDTAVQIRQVTASVSDGSANLDTVLGLTIGSRINISDSVSGHDSDYFIVGEQHTITPGGWDVHRVTWTLKPASREEYWLLEVAGRSELDMSTKLAF